MKQRPKRNFRLRVLASNSPHVLTTVHQGRSKGRTYSILYTCGGAGLLGEGEGKRHLINRRGELADADERALTAWGTGSPMLYHIIVNDQAEANTDAARRQAFR